MARSLKQKIGFGIVVGLLVVSFLFMGVYSFVGSYINGRSAKIASVGGNNIHLYDVQAFTQSTIPLIAIQFGAQPSTLMQTPNLDQIMLQQMINAKVTTLELKKELGITVTKKLVKESIMRNPNFQKDGTFDYQTFLGYLSTAGASEDDYFEYERRSLESQLLVEQIGKVDILGDKFGDWSRTLLSQSREYDVLTPIINAEPEILDEELEKYYEQNKGGFMTDQSFKIKSANIDLNVANPTMKEIVDHYNQSYKNPYQEKFDIAVLNFKTEDEAKDALAQMKSGKGFYTYAKKELELSREDIISEGATLTDLVQEVFEALGDMKTSGLTGVIKTDFGYKVAFLEKRYFDSPDLSAVQSDLVNAMEQERRCKKWSSMKNYVRDTADFSNSIESTVRDVNEKYDIGIQIETTSINSGDGEFADFISASEISILYPQVWEQDCNAKIYSVQEIIEPRIMIFDEVKDRIKRIIREKKRTEASIAANKNLVANLGKEEVTLVNATKSIKGVKFDKASQTVSIADREADQELIVKLFTTSYKRAVEYGGKVYVLKQITEKPIKSESYSQFINSAQQGEYIQFLRDKYDVRIFTPVKE